MFYLIKKYWKYILIFLGGVIFIAMLFISNLSTDDSKDNDLVKKELVKKTTTKKLSSETVFIDIKGAVNAPGVYELEKGKRIIDAINLAGGLSDNANTINVNLSKVLTDEMYIVIYTKNEIANYKKNDSNDDKKITCASNECICPDSNNDACITNDKSLKNTNSNTQKISINSASKENLMTLPTIGSTKADAIIDYREKNGKFNSLEDIKNVSGIGSSTYEKIKDLITL